MQNTQSLDKKHTTGKSLFWLLPRKTRWEANTKLDDSTMVLLPIDLLLIASQACCIHHMNPAIFESLFGCSTSLSCYVWKQLCRQRLLPSSDPLHLLHALLFLKVYGTEPQLASTFNVSRETYRQRLWPMLEALSMLDEARIFFVGTSKFCYKVVVTHTFPPFCL